MAGTIEKLKAKVDNVLHKDKTTTTTTHTGTTGTHGTTGLGNTHGSDPTGPHNSHLANQADPRVDSDRYGAAGNTSGAGGIGAGQYGSSTGTHTGTHTTGTHGTTGGLMGSSNTHRSDPTGPHSSHMANQLDPRVDSDRYGSAGNTASAGGHGAGQYGSSTTGSHTTHGTAGGLGQSHATSHGDPSGPHSSSLMNKLDPTVDTKSYGTANPSTGHYASGNTHTGGLTGSSHNTGYSDPTGPHNSHLANQADPRVDSDRYGAAGNTSGAGGYGAGQYGTTGSSGLTGSHGTHTTGSGLTGSHGTHTTSSGLTGTHGTHSNTTVGSGNSNTTAGPHNSDMLNKLDPRVDSDLNGSKTYGGNQTYQ